MNADTTRHFRIGHIPVCLHSDDTVLLQHASEWLRPFAVDTKEVSELARIQVTLLPCSSPPALLPIGAQPFHRGDTADYFEIDGCWIVRFHDIGAAVVDRAKRRITGYVVYGFWEQSPWYIEDFMHPLMELLRQEGLYAYHSAAVSYEGKGILIAGKSGQGKTTLSVSLLDRGFRYLSDDRCFLQERTDGGCDVIGFYEPARVFAPNMAHLSTSGEIAGAPRLENGKHNFDVGRHYPGGIGASAPLGGILFPAWSPGERSRLEPVAPGQALMTLLPLTLVCFDPDTGKRQFDFLGRLVRRLPAVRLVMGDDKEQWHPLTQAFIESSRELGNSGE